MQLYDKYKKDKQAYERARAYVAQLDNRDCISGSLWCYSSSHSKFMATICGQSSPGARNYHESPDELNHAVLESLDIRAVLNAGVERLRLAMIQSLKNCQEEIEGVKAELDLHEEAVQSSAAAF